MTRRLGLIRGVALTALALGAALLSWVWTPYGVTGISIADKLKPPSAVHPFGTDHFGRDILSMVMVGARTSLAVALVAASQAIWSCLMSFASSGTGWRGTRCRRPRWRVRIR